MNSSSICRNCLRRITRQPNTTKTRSNHRTYSYFSKSATTSSTSSGQSDNSPSQIDPAALLSTPTWSIQSLLSPSSSSSSNNNNPPTKEEPSTSISITPTQLTHLLRLSSLPTPTSPQETNKILSTLKSQLLFVKAIQKVNTSGIPPLPSIRDESPQGTAESTISLEHPSIKEALSSEEQFGHCQRPRRKRGTGIQTNITSGEKRHGQTQDWDVLATASEKAGRYFVVRSKKAREN